MSDTWQKITFGAFAAGSGFLLLALLLIGYQGYLTLILVGAFLLQGVTSICARHRAKRGETLVEPMNTLEQRVHERTLQLLRRRGALALIFSPVAFIGVLILLMPIIGERRAVAGMIVVAVWVLGFVVLDAERLAVLRRDIADVGSGQQRAYVWIVRYLRLIGAAAGVGLCLVLVPRREEWPGLVVAVVAAYVAGLALAAVLASRFRAYALRE